MSEPLENPHVALNNARNLPRAFHFELDRVPGRNETPFKLKLYIDARNEQVVTEYCVVHLRERGYYVTAPDAPWEKPGAFCKRIGIYSSRLSEWVQRYELRGIAPIRVERKGGKSGPITALQSNPTFEDFCHSLRRAPRKQTS